MAMRRISSIFIGASLFLISTAALAGDFKTGWAAYNAADYAKAKAEWQEAADAGDADCAFGMGLLYGNGFGVDMVDELALKYYRIAAEQGHRDGAFNLAVMHQNGWGVPMDEIEANKWYEIAADKGHTEAQMALGRYYAMDFQHSYDPVVAYKWFALAEKLGNVAGAEKRDFVAGRMTPEQLAEARRIVEDWMAAHPGIKGVY